ncbi:gametogenetin-binding protein 2 [Gastrophryne carolinensis]
MARLVAVCRDGEEEFPFDTRQIPLCIDETLTMVMEFSDNKLPLDKQQIDTMQLKQFVQRHSMLSEQELSIAMMVTSREVFNALSQLVPCVGCRRSVERLFTQLVESGNPALDPLSIGPKGVLTLSHSCMTDATKLYTLFYVRGSKLSNMIEAIPKSKKNKRCQLHSLDTHKPKPLGGNWMDIWEVMSQECRDEVVLIDSSCLLETLENYLRKHRFCTDCKNKVLRAYNILIGELDCSKEKGYCAALYEGLRCCPHERHIHVCCETDFIAHLLGRAEPEFAGGYERRERHAKTIDIAQEEVLTCLGIHLYERLHRIWQKLRAEEQTWQMLFYLGVDALRKSFEMTVEKVQGISRLEQLCEEFLEEERVQELKQEKKRQKKKNRRKNKCACDMPSSPSMETVPSSQEKETPGFDGCKSCSGLDDNTCVEVVITHENSSCTCPNGGDLLASSKTKKGLTTRSNGSDCGYSSSMEGSEPGSREGSDVACTEGICNHDEAGEDSCVNCDKEEEEGDSCVECWAIAAEDNMKGKNKKKKKKCKPFKCDKENDESECTSEEEDGLSQDEIQAFMENNQSFYSNRQQFRQYLKEKFNNAPEEEGVSDPLLDLVEEAKSQGSLQDVQVNPQLPDERKRQLHQVLGPFSANFTGKPGRTTVATHHVDTGAQPPLRQVAYRVSPEIKAHIQKEIEDMLKLGVIKKSKSPWASPVVLVPKKDKSTRFCVDYRRLNAVTTFDAYPMPRIDELLDQLAGSQYVTIMDLSRGYWQIPMTPEAQERSAFITPFGLFECCVMPFGMKNAPATFQRLVDQLLEGHREYAVAYLDDIAIFSKTWEEHLIHLHKVVKQIAEAGLTIKPEKCQVGMTEVQYLGHRVGGGTLRPEPSKVESIMAWPIPKTKKQVMSFLGTAGYYRRFVPDYSKIAKPRTDLTKKKVSKQITWTEDCNKAFVALKTALSNSPVLQAPDFSKRFVVQTDASNFGLGAVLSQVNSHGEEHPILYLSRKLLPREVAYAVIEKECLAMVWALQKLQPYLYGRDFTVITDHNPLHWLDRVSGNNGKLLRWSLILQQYNFTVQHRKGSLHQNADGLSRQGEIDC